mmetsp:Transcript_69925/g.202653  ORF Transcript_69925/g.202653 Transcript_69925/m.202653 type:complete len:373 (+) Transcript_69925:556-1674(+)
MACEGPDDVVDAGGPPGVAAGHEVLRAADDADGQAAAERLAVAHDVGLNVIRPLRAPRVQAESRVDLVEDQRDAAGRACLPQLVQPLLVTRRGPDLAVVRGKHGVARRRLVQVETLQRVDQNCCDLSFADLDDLQRKRAHVLKAEDVVGDALVARDGLHAIPPTVIGAAEGDAELPPGVEAGHTHGAHHGLRAGHVEGDLRMARDLAQHRDVVQHGLVQRAQEQALLLRGAPASFDELLVGLVAADVDAVGAADVHGLVPIQVHDIDALRPLQCHRRVQILLYDPIEGGETTRGGEAEVGDHLFQLGRKLLALRILFLPGCAELLNGPLASLGHLSGATVTIEKGGGIDGIFGDDPLHVLERQRQRISCRNG